MAAYAPITYKKSEASALFDIPFDYLSQKFIVVLVQDVLQTYGVDYDFLDKTRVRFLRGNIAAGVAVTLERSTDASSRLVSWRDASVLKALDLELSQLQLLHVAEEAAVIAKLALATDFTFHWNALGKRITNVANPVAPQDAATSGWVTKYIADFLALINGGANAAGNVLIAGFSGGIQTVQDLATSAGSGIIGYKNKLAGGIARSLASKLDDIVSVKDFGATGDGVTDDTQAFLAAGEGAYVPPGVYRITSDIQGTYYSAGGASVIGEGFVFLAALTDRAFTGKTVEITVGNSGKFATLGAALEFAHRKYRPTFLRAKRVNVSIRLLAGFVMREQIVIDSISMNFIRITADDAMVPVDFLNFSEYDTERRLPLFHATHGGKSPVIGVLFNVTDPGSSDLRVAGFTGSHGGVIELLPGAGIQNAERGVAAYYSGEVHCGVPGLTTLPEGASTTSVGVIIQNCRGRAVFAAHGGRINVPRAQLQNCSGDLAVYGIWNSFINIYQSDISGSTGAAAVYIRDGSICCARETCVSGAVGNGYHALHSARIDARYHANSWSKTGAINVGGYCVLASYNSQIDCSELPCTGNKGSAAVHASMASAVTAEYVDASNSFRGFYAAGGSTIYATGGLAKAALYQAVRADTGGHVECSNIDVSGSIAGLQAESGGSVTGSGVVATGCSRAVQAISGGSIVAQGVSATGATDRGVSCLDGSTVDVRGGNLSGAGNYGITCRDGSRVLAGTCNARKGSADATSDVHLGGLGNWVHFGGSTGGLFQTANTLTSTGVIFK